VELQDNKNKHTPKKFRAEWKANSKGEAGDFIETCSRGGIVMFSKDTERGKYQ
jgi:hypothetical protein